MPEQRSHRWNRLNTSLLLSPSVQVPKKATSGSIAAGMRGSCPSSPYEPPTGLRVELTGDVTANVLAAAAAEAFTEARRRYLAAFHPDLTDQPTPPPWVRRQRIGAWAERLVATALDGNLATAGNHGYDLVDGNGRRVQVKASVRNQRSGLISTLQFKSGPGYSHHDLLVHVEMSACNYPVRAWLIESDVLRNLVPNDGKTHQVEPILVRSGTDITDLVHRAYDQLVAIG